MRKFISIFITGIFAFNFIFAMPSVGYTQIVNKKDITKKPLIQKTSIKKSTTPLTSKKLAPSTIKAISAPVTKPSIPTVPLKPVTPPALPLAFDGQEDLIVKIDANPQQGFAWPYYLFIPKGVKSNSLIHLLVETNNTGTTSDDYDLHDQSARKTVESGFPHTFANNLNVPLLVPVFPRPNSQWQLYVHALNRATMLTDEARLKRIDLQLMAMVEDARQRLKTTGIPTEDRILMTGFSASGQFANRFTVMHPDFVRAVVTGGFNSLPLLPVTEYKDKTLRYPIGVSDLETITGSKFNLEEYKKVPLYMYMGSQDTNDAVKFRDSFEEQDANMVNLLFSDNLKIRWQQTQDIEKAQGLNAKMVSYPGIGHSISNSMVNDITSFLKANSGKDSRPARPTTLVTPSSVPSIPVEAQKTGQVVKLYSKCFKFYCTPTYDEITTFVIRQALPASVKNFSYIRVTTFLSNNTPEEAIDMTRSDVTKRNIYGYVYDDKKGFYSWATGGIDAHMNVLFLYDTKKNLLGYHVIESKELIVKNPTSPQVKSTITTNAIKIDNSSCFALYGDPNGITLLTFVIRESLPPEVRNFTHILTTAWPGSRTVEDALANNQSQKLKGFAYDGAGFKCDTSTLKNCKFFITLYDAKGTLLGYHLADAEDLNARKDLLKELLITFDPPVNKDRLTWSDFNMVRKINGVIDSNFKKTGGTSGWSKDGDGHIVSVELRELLKESPDITYEVTPKDSSIVIKDVKIQSPLWEE